MARKKRCGILEDAHSYSDGCIIQNKIYVVTCDEEILLHEYELTPYVFGDPAVYEYRDKHGYADSKTSEIIIPAKWDYAELFYRGCARVTMLDKDEEEQYGFIDMDGNYILEPVYYEATQIRSADAIALWQNGKLGLADYSGKMLLPFDWDSVIEFYDNTLCQPNPEHWEDRFMPCAFLRGEECMFYDMDKHESVFLPKSEALIDISEVMEYETILHQRISRSKSGITSINNPL